MQRALLLKEANQEFTRNNMFNPSKATERLIRIFEG